MANDEALKNLLILYAGLLLINVVLTGALWARSRNVLYGTLFAAWASTAVSFVLQGTLVQSSLLLAIGFSSTFPINLAFAMLLARAAGVPLSWRPFVAMLAAGLAGSAVLFVAGATFMWVAIPTAAAVALPSLVAASRALPKWRSLSISVRALLGSCVLFSLHNLDWPFLRDKPEFAALGFTVATLIIFALSVSALAVVLEQVTQTQARIATEMEAARRIQMHILPREPALPGLEVVTHVRPAESVGGDYFDVCGFDDQSWVLVGDVTGHGLGAGLVMLMAQSTIGSILRARPDISPRELNYLANRVLCSNLERLGEKRHMTVVSIRRLSEDRFAISGCHDDIYILRAASADVEVLPVAHFPMGIGFMDDLLPSDFEESTFRLGPGDVLFVGTDGVTEAARHGDPVRGVFGDGPLREILREHAHRPLAQMRDALLQKLDQFTGGIYHDDVAFVIVRAQEAARS